MGVWKRLRFAVFSVDSFSTPLWVKVYPYNWPRVSFAFWTVIFKVQIKADNYDSRPVLRVNKGVSPEPCAQAPGQPYLSRKSLCDTAAGD